MSRYGKVQLMILAFATSCIIIYHNCSTSYRLEQVIKGKLLQRASFSNVTKKKINAVEYNVTAQIPPEQKPIPAPLLGWRKNVHWEPGAELDIYDFLINPVDKCNTGKDNFTLLVLIKSAPGNTERRDAARRTLIDGALKFNVSTRLLFIMGDSEAQDKREKIQEEARRHRDILKVGFHDGYYNLTIKLVMGFKWALQFCNNSEFLMSMDDDVMVDIVTLVNDLDALPPQDHFQFVLGDIRAWTKPFRNVWSKWYMPEDIYPDETYPPYPLGPGYVMSHHVVKKLYLISRETPATIPFDDVYCGMLLHKLNISIVHRPRWFKDRHPQKKKQDYLKIELSPQKMEKAWTSFEEDFEK
ncbi:beta-1,3-galactosyltransferase 5-like [Strongylocentrotus purpuratus]|uniref:Hexosyltransferase n=1 Tax=Strongylocentrotus purpuratus TaxID=7668 RepID=A0A7M7HNQ6_STRPU|nr:beta-1,3-galactosyltransferase 5-like [Strongylocentrotus purpuratus]|eukprot:XP_011677717.1 PREDICTED: beta-1,3-galactosyltransferase 5-like [Strongylocentrotus purpuratus]